MDGDRDGHVIISDVSDMNVVDLTRSSRHEVPLIHLGAEIHSQLADQIQPVHAHNVLHNRDLIIYYDPPTMSFRHGRVRVVPSPRDVIQIGSQMKTIPVEITDDGQVQLIDLIDILVYRQDSVPARWIQGQVLGQGAFGLVFEAIDLSTGTRLAVKQVHITTDANRPSAGLDHQIQRLCRELQMLKSLSHVNIIRYLGGRLHPEHGAMYIFMELVSSGSLAHLIRNYGPLPESLICNYTQQIVLGLQYLHDNGIVHRDIKSSNILLTTDGVIKLADFGAARQLQDACCLSAADTTAVCGTPAWMAPEVVRQRIWSASSDIWSLGCVMIEMGSGARPWSQYNPNQILWMLAETDHIPDVPGHLSDQAQSMLRACLQRDPRLRPLTRQLLEHPFLAQSELEPIPAQTTFI